MVCLLHLARVRLLWVVVVGNSMQPTFKTGDLVFVDRRAYRETDPRRGDVVVIPYRNELVIKRIVGLPGEELELKGGLLYVNGLPLQENHSGTSGDLDIGK